MNTSVHLLSEILTFPFREQTLGRKEVTIFRSDPSTKIPDSNFHSKLIDHLMRHPEFSKLSIEVLEAYLNLCFFDGWDKEKEISNLELLYNVSNDFLQVNGNKLILKTNFSLFKICSKNGSFLNKFLMWQNLCLLCSKDLFLCASLLNLDPDVSSRLLSSALPFDPCIHPLNTILDKGIAESHLHSGSAFDSTVLWPKFLYFLKEKDDFSISNFDYKHRRDKLYIRCLCGLIIRCLLIWRLKFKIHRVSTEIILNDFLNDFLLETGYLDIFNDIYQELNINCEFNFLIFFLNKIYCNPKNLTKDSARYLIILQKIVKKLELKIFLQYSYKIENEFTYNKELYFLFYSLDYISSNPEDTLFQKLFWDYIRIKNSYHNFIVQHYFREGLTFFKNEFFESGKILKHIRKYYFSNLSKLVSLLDPNHRIKKLEIRTSPDFEDILAIQKGIKKCENYSDTQTGLIVHFIKDKKKPKNFSSISNEILYQFLILKKISSILLEWNMPLRLVGLDVAGSEMNCPNWYYLAPFKIFREWWRKNINLWPIGYTFHAGEDFYTIYQGMRHLGEILFFFPWENGDRIGHALALSISAKEWISQRNGYAVPIESYLDDLLWEYYLYREKKLSPPFHSLVTRIEGEIVRIGEKFFRKSCNVESLLKTYRAKFDLSFIHKSGFLHDIWKSDSNFQNFSLYLSDAEIQDFQNYINMHISPKVNVIESIQNLFKTDEEIERIEAIQKYLLKQFIQDREIAIEACPTSNIVIRGMEDYTKLPSINLFKKNFENVSINTDNPLIFATNLDNEFLQFFLAVKEDQSLDAIKIIEKCRKVGLSFNFCKF